MDKITLGFEIKFNSFASRWDLTPICEINNERFMQDYLFNIWNIMDTFKSCEYEIFTCECGFSPCAGLYNTPKIIATDSTITWKIFDPKECEFTFDRVQYIYEFKLLQANMLRCLSLKKWKKVYYFINSKAGKMPFLKYNF